jgi:glycosyltransferase involved in cell wall biosynthesis
MTKESINCSVVGSFSDRKGQANFLNVVKSLKTLSPAIRFHFYGEDEVQGSGNKKAFLDKVESEGLNDVVMAHGFESKSEIYKNTDILCVPSLWDESFGLVCIEAMSRKIPVVATRVGGLPEVVEDGVCGYIVDGYNYTDFSNKILSLAVSPEKRRLMGEKGRERFEQLFKAERMCSDYDQIIKDLL